MRRFFSLLIFLPFVFISKNAVAVDPDWPTWRIEEKCQFCTEHGIGMVCKFEELRGMTNMFMDSLDNMANAHEVDSYIECFVQGRFEPKKADFLKAYQDEYRSHIASASRSFGVPPQLMQCTFLRESYFDKDIDKHREEQLEKSIKDKTPEEKAEFRKEFKKKMKTGARGLCQINKITADHVNEVLVAAQAVKGVPTSPTDKKNMVHWSNWNSYFEDLRGMGKYKSDTPIDFSYETGTQIPQNCIGAAGLYFNDMLYQISAKLGVGDVGEVLEFATDGEKENATLNLMLVLGAAYNMGPHAASKVLKKLDTPTSLSAMVKVLEEMDGYKETKGYMGSLKRCMTEGDYSEPVGWYRKKDKEAIPNCSEQKQQQQEGSFGETNFLDHWYD